MGLYQRHGSRFWWMTYTMNEERYFESTKTTSKHTRQEDLEAKEGEIAMGLFKVGWPGREDDVRTIVRRVRTFTLRRALGKHGQRSHRSYINNLKLFFRRSQTG